MLIAIDSLMLKAAKALIVHGIRTTRAFVLKDEITLYTADRFF